LDAYTAKAVKYGIVDQQVRSVDVGKSQVGVAMVTRGKLVAGVDRKGAVAEHEQVSEVYHVIEGTATLLTGPNLVNGKKRPDSEKTVRLQNGPGLSADSIVNPEVHHLKPGDVIEAEIERIGVLRNPVVSWQEAHGEPTPPRVHW